MRESSIALLCLLLMAPSFLTALGTSKRFVTPAFRGRGYGSPTSNEVARRITIAKDGFVYIAGTTTVKVANEEAWGDRDGTGPTSGVDVFLAKLAPSGVLKWVKRIGSTRDETLNDLKLHKGALYLCGATTGDLGKPLNGSSDAFIMKFSTQGIPLWKRVFQFGSSKGDACKGLDVDETTGAVYAVGNTEGDAFESSAPAGTGTHEFIAKVVEVESAEVDVAMERARQKNSAKSSSADALVVTNDNVMCMTITWNSTKDPEEDRAVTYISRYNRENLVSHQADAVSPQASDNFHGLGMDVISESGDAFIVGTTNFADGKKGYYALAYSSTANAGRGGILWETFLGYVSPYLKFTYHSPAISVDAGRELVYVAGTEEGIFFNDSTETSGIMILPFFEVNMTTGVVTQKWQRATPLSKNRQELTDLAHNGHGAVLFTGLWNEGPNETTQALVGSYGSVASRTDGSILGDPGILVNDRDDERDTRMHQDPSKMFLIVGLSLSALFLVAVMIAKCRSRSTGRHHEQRFRHVVPAEIEDEDDDVERQKKRAVDAYRAKSTAAMQTSEIRADQVAGPQ